MALAIRDAESQRKTLGVLALETESRDQARRAAGIRAVLASLSGAEGGCQSETGAGAGMAAGAATEMLGGSPGLPSPSPRTR